MWGSPVGVKVLSSATTILVPTSNKARLFNMNIIAGASTVVKIFDNGQGGTLKVQENLATNVGSLGKTIDYGINGQLFDNGIFVQLDANVTSVTLAYRWEEAN